MKQFLVVYNVYTTRYRGTKWWSTSDTIRYIYMTANAPTSATLGQVREAVLKTRPAVGLGESVELLSVHNISELQQINLGETIGLEVVESDE